MAKEFARRGYDLALCARRLEPMQALGKEIMAASPNTRIEIETLDVNDHPAVHRVFHAFLEQFGRLDRIVVNAGIGTSIPVGKGGMSKNIGVAQTNFTAALAQAETAMVIFRERDDGHLVFISSMSAMRGMRGAMTVYAATKAGLAALSEGLQVEVMRKPGLRVSTIFPGYIRTEMNEHVPASATPFIIDAEKGSRLMVDAIESERGRTYVPWWPWAPLGWLMRRLPLKIAAKLV